MAKGKAVQAARIIRNRLAGRCPVTGGCVTRMTEESFLRVCGRHQELARKKAGNVGWGGPGSAQFCIECQGKHLPQELEIIDMEENMPSKKAEGKCDCCGKTKRVKKVHGYMACSICEHLVRAVKNSPELVRRLWGDAHGAEIGGNEEGLADGIRQALNVPGDVASGELPRLIGDLMLERGQYAAVLDGVRKALEAAVDDDLVEVAGRRMAMLRKLDEMYNAEHKRRDELAEVITCMEQELEDSRSAASSLQAELDELCKSHHLLSATVAELEESLEVAEDEDVVDVADDMVAELRSLKAEVQRLRDKPKPAILTVERQAGPDMIPLSRLVADEELRVQIDGLARLLGERQ